MGFFDRFDDFGKDLIDDLGGAVKDFGDQLWDNISKAADNLVNKLFKLDDALKDLWELLLERLPEMLLKMLHDPKFWKALLIFLGMVVAGEAFAASMSAPKGERWAAFCKEAGIVYHKTGIPFITKSHRVAYLVSPDYRDSFDEHIAPEIRKLTESGVDIGLAAQLIGDVWSLGRSMGTLLGQDWEASKDSWDTKFRDFGEAIEKHSTDWGASPEKMIDWLDKNLIAPEQNKAAAFINSLSGAADWVLEKGDDIADKLGNISDNMGNIADDLTGLGYPELAENFRKGKQGIGDILLAEWNSFSKQLSDLRDIIEVEVMESDIQKAVVKGLSVANTRIGLDNLKKAAYG